LFDTLVEVILGAVISTIPGKIIIGLVMIGMGIIILISGGAAEYWWVAALFIIGGLSFIGFAISRIFRKQKQAPSQTQTPLQPPPQG
jgi:hypothetical protein